MISFQHFSLIRIALTAYHPAKINTTTTNQYTASALCRLPCKRGLGFAHRDHGQQPNGHYTHVWQKGDSMINVSNNCWRTRTQTSTRHLERLKWTSTDEEKNVGKKHQLYGSGLDLSKKTICHQNMHISGCQQRRKTQQMSSIICEWDEGLCPCLSP